MRAACAVAALVLGGCAIDSSGLAARADAGARDGGLGVLDAPAIDAPRIDSPPTDAPLVDAPPDTGPPPVDAGPPDAGPPDGGPPDCRESVESCSEPGLGAVCADTSDCWPGLECCTTNDCKNGAVTGVCTVLSCGADGTTDGCPLDMICRHDVCFFPCDMGECPHPLQGCQHGQVCEWG